MAVEYYDEVCPICDGDGWIYESAAAAEMEERTECWRCNGSGLIEEEIEDDREEIDRHH